MAVPGPRRWRAKCEGKAAVRRGTPGSPDCDPVARLKPFRQDSFHYPIPGGSGIAAGRWLLSAHGRERIAGATEVGGPAGVWPGLRDGACGEQALGALSPAQSRKREVG